MKLLTAILLAGMAGCAAWGQQTCTPVMGGYTGNDGIVWQTLEECKNPVSLGYLPAKPLKCGKYQHVESPDVTCGDVVLLGKDGTLVSSCFKEHCADDMHPLKESEWQEMQQTIKEWKRFHENLVKLRDKLDAEQKPK